MAEHPKELLARGRDHYEKGELALAEPLLAQVVEANDGFADVHNMLGVIAHARGDIASAERHLTRAVAINPAYTEALLNLAVTCNDAGKYDEARTIYARVHELGSGTSAVTLDPFARGKLANMHADVAQAYAEVGLPRDAILEYERAIALCPSFADLRTRLGTLYRDLGELGRAREQYQAARAANPRYAPARVQLGVTLLQLGDTDAALAEWRHVLELDPDNQRAQMYTRMVEAQRAAAPRDPAPPSAPHPPARPSLKVV